MIPTAALQPPGAMGGLPPQLSKKPVQSRDAGGVTWDGDMDHNNFADKPKTVVKKKAAKKQSFFSDSSEEEE